MFKYYFYQIRNIENEQKYIGITCDWQNRKNQHFTKLSKRIHCNPHLQNAVNKYGLQNFSFEIIEEKEFETKQEAYLHEAELIKTQDSIRDGYNCNPGGLWTGPQGKFTKQEVFYIKAACLYNNYMTGVLGELYNCAGATINNIKINRNYKPWCLEFEGLPEKEKMDIYEDFCDLTNFELLKTKAYIKSTQRKYTKDQVFIILLWCETKFVSAKEICDNFNISYPKNPQYKCANKFRSIREGTTYKDYTKEYESLNEEEKQAIKRLYTVKYIE
jgi:group I intron endonuclease